MRRLTVSGPYDLVRTLRPLADSGADPTWRFERGTTGARVLRAMWTPGGAATVELCHPDGSDGVEARAMGPGAEWVLERVDWMIGAHDDPGALRSELHPVVAALTRTRAGLRLGRSLSVWDPVVPTVLGQRVTTGEAHRSWWGLVRRHGHAAPGTGEVRLSPTPRTVARLGDADWHRLGVERARADAVRGLVARLGALQRIVGEPEVACAERTTRFRLAAEGVRGVGPWTSTLLATRLLGDADVVLLGDLHLPHAVCHALAGEERGDDRRMLELLEPFRPHRGRVVRLVVAAGLHAPRRAPRYTPLPIAAM